MPAVALQSKVSLHQIKRRSGFVHKHKLNHTGSCLVFAMRAVVQRVRSASVEVDGRLVSSIGPGLLCLIGIRDTDTAADQEFLCVSIAASRYQNTGLATPCAHLYELGARL